MVCPIVPGGVWCVVCVRARVYVCMVFFFGGGGEFGDTFWAISEEEDPEQIKAFWLRKQKLELEGQATSEQGAAPEDHHNSMQGLLESRLNGELCKY